MGCLTGSAAVETGAPLTQLSSRSLRRLHSSHCRASPRPCGQPPPQGGSVNLGSGNRQPWTRTPALPTSPVGPSTSWSLGTSSETWRPTLAVQSLAPHKPGKESGHEARHTEGAKKCGPSALRAQPRPDTLLSQGLHLPTPSVSILPSPAHDTPRQWGSGHTCQRLKVFPLPTSLRSYEAGQSGVMVGQRCGQAAPLLSPPLKAQNSGRECVCWGRWGGLLGPGPEAWQVDESSILDPP